MISFLIILFILIILAFIYPIWLPYFLTKEHIVLARTRPSESPPWIRGRTRELSENKLAFNEVSYMAKRFDKKINDIFSSIEIQPGDEVFNPEDGSIHKIKRVENQDLRSPSFIRSEMVWNLVMTKWMKNRGLTNIKSPVEEMKYSRIKCEGAFLDSMHKYRITFENGAPAIKFIMSSITEHDIKSYLELMTSRLVHLDIPQFSDYSSGIYIPSDCGWTKDAKYKIASFGDEFLTFKDMFAKIYNKIERLVDAEDVRVLDFIFCGGLDAKFDYTKYNQWAVKKTKMR